MIPEITLNFMIRLRIQGVVNTENNISKILESVKSLKVIENQNNVKELLKKLMLQIASEQYKMSCS